MKRKFVFFDVENISVFKIKMLNWCSRFNIFCFLDNHSYKFEASEFEWILAAGEINRIMCDGENLFDQFDAFCEEQNEMLFGHLSYDIKNEIEDLSSDLPDGIKFPALCFFSPKVIIKFSDNILSIGLFDENFDAIFEEINSCSPTIQLFNTPEIKSKFTKQEYLEVIEKLKEHIHVGDCYEINFCQEFYAQHQSLDPLQVYLKLSSISPNPYSCFYKLDDKYLMCASPERYCKRVGSKIISQPIKGTAKRNLEDSTKDIQSGNDLLNSIKERSENVMIVDLVRNDLSKISRPGSVKVDELFGIYPFPQLYQMISTVSAELEENISLADVIRTTFPMGSMTGAPKKKVMELIEKYERTKRGLFSGSVGYIKENGDFDFNVVIRSILFNSTSGYLSFSVGSAITFYSDAEKEYEECLLKAEAIRKALSL